jgi:hypothetical protein
MNYIDIWVIEEFNGDYVKALQHCLKHAEDTRNPKWIPYLEDISARLDEQAPKVNEEDDGRGSARMLGIVMIGTIAFWGSVGIYLLN